MNRHIVLIFLAASFCFAAIASAADNDYFKSRMWKRHEKGIESVLRCFKNNCTPREYGEYFEEIASAELSLQIYGVSPTNPRLVSHMASDMKSISDFPIFAYKLFKKRLNEVTGFSPAPAGSFEGENFSIFTKKDSSQRFDVQF